MIRAHRCATIATLSILALATCVAQPAMERMSIEGGAGAGDWTTAEADATTSDLHAELGDESLLLHIDVNHETGEIKYPIGWPRIYLDIPEELRDWQGYDYLELSVHTESSRDDLPSKGLGMILYTPDKARQYQRNLTELTVGETSSIVIPLSEIARHGNVTRMQFYISESEFKHGDVLDFFIDDIALTRFAEPALSEVVALQSIAYDDAEHLGVKFRLLGLAQGEVAQVAARLRQGDAVVAEGMWALERGTHEAWLKLTQAPQPGVAQLDLFVGPPEEVATIRIIPGPFNPKGGGE
ncbi:MAG TPA: hypothetical protein QGH10_05735 [Armatimonadota bacterium]|nr:hypothetical protein [Armatimonadota bacterium]